MYNILGLYNSKAKYDPDIIQGTILQRTDIERQIERCRSKSIEARREIVGLQHKRADVLLAGACMVRTTKDKLGKDSLTFSDRGLRHGLLVDRLGE